MYVMAKFRATDIQGLQTLSLETWHDIWIIELKI